MTEGRLPFGEPADERGDRRQEDRLGESDRVLREAAERVGRIGSYVLDIQAGTWKSSRVLDAIFGIEPDYPRTVEGWAELVHPSERDEMRAYFADVVAERRRFEREYRIVRASDDAERWVLGMGEVEYGEDGTPLRMVGVIQDVTERKRVEDELKAARDELEQLLAASPAVTYRLEARGNYRSVYISPNVVTHLGYEPEEFLEDEFFWTKRLHPDEAERFLAQEPQRLQGESHTSEYRFLHKDGTYRWMRDEISVVRDENGEPVELVGNWIDITEAKKLEAQYIQAQKMEAVGRLTGGIAHDFNNILTAVQGNLELALERLDANDAVRGFVDEARRAGERAAALTRQLLAFSRQQVLEPRVVDLDGVVGGVQSLLRRTIGEDIDLVVELGAEAGRVMIDPGQLEQVLLNLAVNARDAMPDGGSLVLGTALVELDGGLDETGARVTPGRYVELGVGDTGHGMDEETRKRIFEPFFTTKEKDRGTGLGLPTVYGIVRQSGGYIDLDSEPGEGAKFTIYLPRVDAEVEPAPSTAPDTEPAGGSETILLVEDEAPVRKIATRILEGQGYRVLTAEEPAEALQTVERHQGPIDLVITDVVLPGTTGVELVEQIKTTLPTVPVLYISGYAHHDVFEDLDPEEVQFLQKPFGAEVLGRKVREVLDAGA